MFSILKITLNQTINTTIQIINLIVMLTQKETQLRTIAIVVTADRDRESIYPIHLELLRVQTEYELTDFWLIILFLHNLNYK